MAEILKPILLDETGQVTNTKLSEHTSQMGEALQTIADAINGLGNITNNDGKINTPKNSDGTISNGTRGQILQTNGDGTTQWVNKPSGSTSTGGVVEETDPTVPEWAKQSTKPTYTASEVGALDSSIIATDEETELYLNIDNSVTNTTNSNIETDTEAKII